MAAWGVGGVEERGVEQLLLSAAPLAPNPPALFFYQFFSPDLLLSFFRSGWDGGKKGGRKMLRAKKSANSHRQSPMPRGPFPEARATRRPFDPATDQGGGGFFRSRPASQRYPACTPHFFSWLAWRDEGARTFLFVRFVEEKNEKLTFSFSMEKKTKNRGVRPKTIKVREKKIDKPPKKNSAA